MDNDFGTIYLLENPAMPGLIKIGVTVRGDHQIRMNELYSTGVPVPFNCVYAGKVKDPEKVEKALHTAFAPNRLNPRREFFEIDAGQAIGIIKLLEVQDATLEVVKELEEVDLTSREAGERLNKKRPRFNFLEMQIPIGSELVSVATGEIAKVIAETTVSFRNEEMSLTRATKIALENDYNIAPGQYWTYNGRRLRSIYDETYQFPA